MRSSADSAWWTSRLARALVALVCFGPLAMVLLLGVLAIPLWVAMLAMRLSEPERFTNELSGSTWELVWPIVLVGSGLLGLIGLIRVVVLGESGASRLSKKLT